MSSRPRVVAVITVLAVAVVAAVVLVAMRDAVAVQRGALSMRVREQCTTSLAVSKQVGTAYSVRLGPTRFDDSGAVRAAFEIRLVRERGQARLGRLQRGTVRCALGVNEDTGLLGVTSVSVVS